jgi:hypothetical protein
MTDPRIAVLSALSSPGWHPVSEAHGMPWDEAEELLAAYDASRAAVPSAPADRAALRDLAADALADAEGWQWAPGYDKAQSPTYQHYLRQADAVLAVLPEPAARAVILREAADIADRFNSDCQNCAVELEVATKLRRMADEAQQPETQAEVVHACPPDGSGLTPCCGRTPFELPRTDRMSADPTLVTCQPAAASQPGKEA